MSLENNRVGENIKRIRTNKGVTQQWVADKVGLSKQSICKVEKTGSTNPKTLARIADALHVDVHEFYEPAQEHITKSSYPNFFSDEEIKLLIFEYKSIVEKFNDIIAKNIHEKIKEKYREYTTDRSKIQSVLETRRFHSETYTHEQLICACGYLTAEIFSDIYGIFLSAE